MIIGIVVALSEELSTLKPLPLYAGARFSKGGCVLLSDQLLVAYSGAGCQNAQTAAEALVQQGVSALISWGCAAALGDSLKPGDLTLADCLITAEGTKLEIDSGWRKHVLAVLSPSTPVIAGSLAESKTLVADSADKIRLQQQTGAIALDMESIAIAQVAARHDLPFVAIRAIADPVSMDLPKAVSHALNGQGDVVLSKLLSFLALHPFELPGLVKLGLHFNAAKNTLKKAAGQLEAISHYTDTQDN